MSENRFFDSPVLPPEAEDEILTVLFTDMKISTEKIVNIFKKYDVSGDVDALQDRYRKRLGQRLMAGIRDECGQREVLAHGSEYIVLECCNDQKALKAIRHRIESQVKGLDVSAAKVNGRIHVLDRLIKKSKRCKK